MADLTERIIEFSFNTRANGHYFNVAYHSTRKGIDGLGHFDFEYLLNDAFSSQFNPQKIPVNVLYPSDFPRAERERLRERAQDYSLRNKVKVSFNNSDTGERD